MENFYRAYTIIDNELYWFCYDYEYSSYGNTTYKGQRVFCHYYLSKDFNFCKSNFKTLEFLKRCLKESNEDFDIKRKCKGKSLEFNIVKTNFIQEDNLIVEF